MTDKSGAGRRGSRAVSAADVDAVLTASRVVVAISAESIAEVGDTVDLLQFRALVIVGSLGSASLGELAEAAGLSLSTASRLCDRLVNAGLLDRVTEPGNRRQLRLTLREAGHELVRRAMRYRQERLEPILRQLPGERRRALVDAFAEFADAAGEPRNRDVWFLGWPTEKPVTTEGRTGQDPD